MILQSIRLHPFAGATDKTYTFNEGLNVILGPNEDGKSTVAKAIQQVLFLPTNLTPARRTTALQDFMPVAGGDTIRVTLNFTWDDKAYILEKQWGATASTKLQQVNGNTTTDPATVQQQVLNMLPANQAVVEQVLIASQSKLADAVSHLSSDVHSSLSDKLRAAILQGGGISGTMLEADIQQQVSNYFGRWDEAAGKPEGGASRGLANRWTKGAGYIANAWYEWEQAKQTEQYTEHYETESNRLQTILNSHNDELKSITSFLEENKAAYSAVSKRISLEGEIARFNTALDSFAADAKRWPLASAEKETVEEALEQAEKELAEIKLELEQARQKQTAQNDIGRLARIDQLNTEMVAAQKAVSELVEIPEAELTNARQLQHSIDQTTATIQGQKLQFLIDANVDGQIETIHSAGKSETIDFVAGQSLERDITGGIKYEWQGVSFTVRSANANMAELEKKLVDTNDSLDQLLKKYQVATMENLIGSADQFKQATQKALQAQSSLGAALGTDTLESLKLRCDAVKELPATRDVKLLDDLYRDKTTAKGGYQSRLQAVNKELTVYVEKHQSYEHLDERRLNGMQAIRDRAHELSKLSALPEGFESAVAFQDHYNKLNAEKEARVTRKHETDMALKDLVIPTCSLAEAKEQSSQERKKFEQKLAEGKAFRRIQQELGSLLQVADAKAYEPLHTKTEAYLKKLSAGRFQHIPFDITQPQKLEGEGVALPVSLLSKGTRDILALSLRLAAAELYLDGKTGFVVMDDPLVDMDMKRRKASVDVLREFAGIHQTMVFTCHEEHGSLLNCLKTVS